MYNIIYGSIALVTIIFLIVIFNMNVVFIPLAIILAIVLLKRNADLKKNIYKMPEEALHITNVDKGGIFQLRGIGSEMEDMTLKVISKHLYQEGDFYWYELECDKGGGEKVWVEVEDDDDTKVSITLKKLKLINVNLTAEKLVFIDDEESGSINYNGVNYTYEESDEAIFYRHCDDAKPEKFYYWDFVMTSPPNNYSITVEKWGDNDYEVYYSQLLKPHQVIVLANKANAGAK